MVSLKQAFTFGLISAIAVYTTSFFSLPTWVLFTAWVSYYLFGTNIKTALLIITQQILGVLIALTIQYFGTHLSQSFNSLGFPMIVFIVMIGVFYISKLKKLNNIPAYFLGMIVWFGSNAQIELNVILILVLTLVLGYFFAWANVTSNEKIALKYSTIKDGK